MNNFPDKDKSKGKKYIARLEGTIEDNVLRLLHKIEHSLGEDFIAKHSPTLLLLSSADGAQYQLTVEGDLNVISYNLAATSKDLYENKYTATQSLNILTHMQVCATESSDVVLSSYETLCKEMVNFNKYKLPEKYHHLNYDFLHVSDSKFLYALT